MASQSHARFGFRLLGDVAHIEAEHLGLLPPEQAYDPNHQPTDLMRPAPHLHDYDFGSEGDKMVEDVLSDQFQQLWIGTGRSNRAAFEKVFRPVPNDTIRNWKGYVDYLTPNAGIPVS